jgi:outer membrane scaffolding protein for murein synthesis (MipA/OmpV family)
MAAMRGTNIVLGALLALCGSFAVHAEEKPLWEVGMFFGVGRLPHYPGSDGYEIYPLPLPYLLYRGQIVEADREGIKGVLYRSPRMGTRLAFSGHPPVEDDNDARAGMAELDPLLEGGISHNIYLRRSATRELYLHASVRQVVSFDWLDARGQGFLGDVQLIYRDWDLRGDGKWAYGLRTGPRLASTDYHQYFYRVLPADATPERRAYDPHGGYGGFTISQNLVYKRTADLSIGLYMRWLNLTGAVIEDSPLVREKNDLVVGGAIIRRFGQSKQMVDR